MQKVFISALLLIAFESSFASRRDYTHKPRLVRSIPESMWALQPIIQRSAADMDMGAYVSVFASQIHQESLGDCKARSKVGARGCAQFMPGTSEWAAKSICRSLGRAEPENPQWAIPCMIRYDWWIMQMIIDSTDGLCHMLAKTVVGYNSGPGYLRREEKETRQAGRNSRLFFSGIEHYSRRAEWAHKQSTHYAYRILSELYPKYYAEGFGGKFVCDKLDGKQ